MDRREDLINEQLRKAGRHDVVYDERDKIVIRNAMDEYMKETVIEAFKFMAKNTTGKTIYKDGHVEVQYKGEWITVEQLFENFL